MASSESTILHEPEVASAKVSPWDDEVHSMKAMQARVDATIDMVERLAKAARVAADGFDRDAPNLAEAVRTVAAGAEQVIAGARQAPLDKIAEAATNLTRGQPLIALFGAFAIGLAIPLLIARGTSRVKL